MYADYSTDSTYPTSYENERNTSGSTPASSTSPSYSTRNASQLQALNGGSPNLNTQALNPQSPKEQVGHPTSSSPSQSQQLPQLRPQSGSPFSGSPRQSTELPPTSVATTSNAQHVPHYVPQRRNSATASIVSEPIVAQYMPPMELGNHVLEESAQSGFDESILRALCDLDVSHVRYV